jgi:Kinesin motor domain
MLVLCGWVGVRQRSSRLVESETDRQGGACACVLVVVVALYIFVSLHIIGGEMQSIPGLDDIHVDPNMNPSVIISYCELYNEQIFDLLVETKRREPRQPLKFKETKHGKVWVHGLREQLVTSEG